MKKIDKWIDKEEADINSELFRKHFKMQRPSGMLKALYTINDKKKNSNLVHFIKSGLNCFKKNENMSKEEKEIEKPDTRY